MQQTIIIRQEPLILLDFTGVLAASSELSKEVPCVGLSFLYGLIYTSKTITFSIAEGVSYPSINYHTMNEHTIMAGDSYPVEWSVHGKYIKVTLANLSAIDSADIEAFLAIRGIE